MTIFLLRHLRAQPGGLSSPSKPGVSPGARAHCGGGESPCLLLPRAPEFPGGGSAPPCPGTNAEARSVALPPTRPVALMRRCPLTCILLSRSLRTPSPADVVTSRGPQWGRSPSAGEAKASGQTLALQTTGGSWAMVATDVSTQRLDTRSPYVAPGRGGQRAA